jgi:hypothetical protein
MDLRVTVDGLEEPQGEVELLRLETFVGRFRTAVMRSAQAHLGVPAYRRTLGDEEPPHFRLVGVSPGSTGLLIRSADDRPVTVEAVGRHLAGLSEYERSGRWPPFIYPGERQAWGEAYRSLVGRSPAIVRVAIDDQEVARVNRGLVDALEQVPVTPEYRDVVVVGELHLIEVEVQPRFHIRTPDLDLHFNLTDDIRDLVDRHRWRRVSAQARWEVGSNRAQLVGDLVESDEPAGVTVVGEVEVPGWVATQVERIRRFGTLADGWLDARSRGVPKATVQSSEELTRRIYEMFGDRIPEGSAPFFGPNSEGDIEFEWKVGDRELICEIKQGTYGLLVVEAGQEVFDGSITQRSLFGWIDWLLGGELPKSST